MRRLWKRSLWLSLGLILALALGTLAAVTALLTTEGGLRLALATAQRFAPGELSWRDVDGRLVGPLQVTDLVYVDGATRFAVERLELEWSPGQLLRRRLSVHRLRVEGVDIQLPASAEEDSEPIEPGWGLPLEIWARELALTDLRIQQGDAEPVVVERFEAALKTGLEWVDIERLHLIMPALQLDAAGRLGLGRDIATDLQLSLQATPPGYAPIATEGRLTGTWMALRLQQQITAPLTAEARLELHDAFDELRWALDLQLPPVRLEQINPDWPPTRLAGQLQGTGGLQQAEVEADLRTDWQASELYPVQVEIDIAEGDDGSLRLQPLQVRQGQARLRLSGGWHPDSEDFNLLLDGQTLQWPLQGEPQWRVPQTAIRVAGRLQDYRVEVQGELQGATLPPLSLSGQGQGSEQGLSVEQLVVTLLDGAVDVRGRVDWAPHLQWQAALSARDLDPGQHWPDWPGSLHARIETSGRQTDSGLTLAAQIEALEGQLRDYPVSGQGAVALADERLSLTDVRLSSGTAQLALNGAVAERWDLSWSLDAPDLGQVLPDLAGRLQAQGDLSGPRAEPRLQATAQLAELVSGQMRLQRFDLRADLGFGPETPLTLTGTGQDLRLDARRIDRLELNLDGRLASHRLQFQAEGPSHGLHLAAQGGWQDGQWQGRIEDSGWRLPETGVWTQRAMTAVRLGAATGRIEDLCWTQQAADLCLQLNTDPGEQRLRLALDAWPLAERAPLLLAPGTAIEDAALSFELQAQRPLDAAQALRAQVDATISPGRLTWTDGIRQQGTEFGGIDLDAELDASGGRATARLDLTGADRLSMQVRLPGYAPGKDPARQALDGSLEGEIRDFALVEGLIGSVDQLSGVLQADADLSGTLAAPRLGGELRLSEGRAFLGPTGITLEELQLNLRGEPGSDRLHLTGSARSGPGQVNLKGEFSGLGDSGMSGSLYIGGTDFEAVNLPEARVLLTPDLHLQVQPKALTVSGTLTVPEARIEPRDLQGVDKPSKDVVLVNQAEEPPPPWAVTSRVKVVLGDKVRFDGFGLTGRLTGALEVIDEPARVTLANGELSILDGEYTAYGQKLKIESGRLLYRGGPIDNPALAIRAVRKSGDVLAGVKVYGDIQSPEMELFSQPSMPQADQLSYLLLGRPLQGASGSEGQLLFQAASSLGIKGGNSLAQKIGNQFGLDEVSVGGGDDLDSAALTIGKYLSPRLYVNYSVGLLDAVNKFQIRYELSRRWSLQTETGTASGGDILYNYETD